MTKLICSIT